VGPGPERRQDRLVIAGWRVGAEELADALVLRLDLGEGARQLGHLGALCMESLVLTDESGHAPGLGGDGEPEGENESDRDCNGNEEKQVEAQPSVRDLVRPGLEVAVRHDDDGQSAIVSHSSPDLPVVESRGARRPSGHDVEGRAAGEKLEDPLEILRAVERDLQLAFHAASPVDADVRSERTLQLLLELTLGRVARPFLPPATTRRTLRSLDLGLDVADAPPLLDRAPRELRNDAVVLRPEQRTGMPCRQTVLRNENASAGRQLEQAGRIGDGRSVLPPDVRALLLRERKLRAQPLVRLRLLECVELCPLD